LSLIKDALRELTEDVRAINSHVQSIPITTSVTPTKASSIFGTDYSTGGGLSSEDLQSLQPGNFINFRREDETTYIDLESPVSMEYGGTGSDLSGINKAIWFTKNGALSQLPPNILTTRKFLLQYGTGAAAYDPEWTTIQASDLPLSGAVAGTFGSATSIPVITIDDRGRVTNVTPTNISGLDAAAISTGTFGTARGGTGLSTIAAFTLPYASAANTLTTLAPNTTTTRKFLRMTGDGTNGAAPAWGTLTAGDIPSLSGSYLPLTGGTLTGQLVVDTTATGVQFPINVTTTIAGSAAVNVTNTSADASANVRFILNNDVNNNAGFQLRSSTHATEPNDVVLYAGTGNINLYTGGNPRVKITSGGRVGINVTAPVAKLHAADTTRVLASSLYSGSDQIVVNNDGSGTNPSAIRLVSSNSTGLAENTSSVMVFLGTRGTNAVPVATAAGDYLGRVIAQGFTGTDRYTSASIQMLQESAVTGGRVPAYLAFFTASTTQDQTERMRITSTGEAVLGLGEATGTTVGGTLRAPDRTGTNVAGTNLTIRAGNGTGTGGSGAIVFSTSPASTTGSTANTIIERMRINNAGDLTVNNSVIASNFYSYRTNNTAGTDATYWYPIATVDIRQRFDATSATLRISASGSSGGTYAGQLDVYFRVKQQNALGSSAIIQVHAPYASQVAVSSDNLRASDVAFVLTQNDATATAGTLYVRNNSSFERLSVTVINRFDTITTAAGSAVSYASGTGVSTLPTGLSQTFGVDVIHARVGNVGIGNTSPNATLAIGTDIGTFSGISIGGATNRDIRVGQAASNNIIVGWKANATPANAYAVVETFGGNNPLSLQSSGGNVGIGLISPAQKLDVGGAIAISGTTVIDASRNLTNIGTIASGNVTINSSGASGVLSLGGPASPGTSVFIQLYRAGTATTRSAYIGYSGSANLDITNEVASGNVVLSPGSGGLTRINSALNIGATAVIDSSGNWVGGTIPTNEGGTGRTSIGTANQILGVNAGATGLEYKTIAAGTNITITHTANTITIAATGGGGGGSGTVTSVGMTVPSFLSVTPSAITTSDTFALSLVTQTANTLFAGPTTGSAAAPTFRALVAADIPSLSYLPTAGGTLTGLLQLAAGTTSVAPLRLVSGANLTSPVAGTIEYNGTDLFFTDATPTRKAVAFKYAMTIGDDTATSFTIPHNLGTRDIQVFLYALLTNSGTTNPLSTAGKQVQADVTIGTPSPYNATISFSKKPAVSQFRVVVLG
jgi:hypothetical protein